MAHQLTNVRAHSKIANYYTKLPPALTTVARKRQPSNGEEHGQPKQEHGRNQRRTDIPSNRRIQPRKHNVTIPEMLGPALRDQQLPDLGGHRRGLLPVHRLPISLPLRSLRRPHGNEVKVRMLGQEEGKPLSYAAGAAQYPAFSLRKACRFGGEVHYNDLRGGKYKGTKEGPS